MGRYIIKIRDQYLEWSTIVDAPVTYGMTLQELREYIKEEYGNEGLEELPQRLERVEKTGTSAHGGDLEGTLLCNRAGLDETELTEDEIYDVYCLQKPNKRGRDRITEEEDD
jgi:RNase P/RNase MRP subunit POP5